MKKKLLACFLAVALVAALVFVVAPTAKAENEEPVVVQATENGIPADFNYDNNILDLKGNNVVIENVPEGETLKVINTSFIEKTTTDGVTEVSFNLSGKHPGSLTVTGTGTVAAVSTDKNFYYLAVQDGNTYTFHPFNLGITRLGLNTLGKDGTNPAVCVEAMFLANDVVKKELEKEGNDYGLQKPSENGEVVFSAKDNSYTFGEANGVKAYYDLAGSLNDYIDNTDELQAYIVIDGEKVTNKSVAITPREVLKDINAGIKEEKIIPTDKQKTAIVSLMEKYTRLNNIFSNYRTGDCTHEKIKNDICLDCDTPINTSAFKLVNGGFENGIDGWTVVGNIGNVSTNKAYWKEEFGMDGEKMFSAYEPTDLEKNVGTLTSSTFTVGGSGFVTFKIGAMKDSHYVYLDVVDAESKEILARYYNGLQAGRDCTLVAYKADLSAFRGKKVFFRISDNSDNDYGLFFADSFVTYYEEEPVDFNVATPVDYAVSGTIYDLFNGGFELGIEWGWWNDGNPGHVTNADAFFSGVPYGKDGNFLYSGVEDYKAGNGLEGNKGTLTSSVFELGGSGYITYMLGGGNDICYVQVIDSTTGEVLARYRRNPEVFEDAVLKTYVADLTKYKGRTVRIQVVDYAENNWGCVSFDNVVTYYETKPEGCIEATDIYAETKYNIINGSFEDGNLNGWKMNVTEDIVEGKQHNCNTLGWVLTEEINEGWYTKNGDRKDGEKLFTFARPINGGHENCEHAKGTLQSSTFTLKQNSYVSFRFGGAGTRDVHIQLCKANGEVVATFYNEAHGKVNTEMFAYYYQYTGDTADCFIKVVDNSTSNYGCFVVDDFRVNLESAPEGFIAAIQ